MTERLEALPLVLDGLVVEAEVRAGRQDPPDVRRVRVVGPVPHLVPGLELLDVAEDLHEATLLGNAHVRAEVAAEAVAQRAPRDPAPVLGEMIERNPDLAPVHELKREMVEVRVPLADE